MSNSSKKKKDKTEKFDNAKRDYPKITLPGITAENTWSPERKQNGMFLRESMAVARDKAGKEIGAVDNCMGAGVLISVKQYQYFISSRQLLDAVMAVTGEDGEPLNVK